MWISKKKLTAEREEYKHKIEMLEYSLQFYQERYPFSIGDTVFDVQLRSSKGRFTKTKASREYSLINEVVVDKKNYFNLVDRYLAKDVFMTLSAAEEHLNEVCID